ncbi:MAG: hypothetical protein WKF83_14145 [Nocardioidaceae bacterium]
MRNRYRIELDRVVEVAGIIAGFPAGDPGADYFTRLRPDTTKNRAIRHPEPMGYTVTLDQPEAAQRAALARSPAARRGPRRSPNGSWR